MTSRARRTLRQKANKKTQKVFRIILTYSPRAGGGDAECGDA